MGNATAPVPLAGAFYCGIEKGRQFDDPSRSIIILYYCKWEKTTGPRTKQGKAVSNMNALKHGMLSAENREVERLIAILGRLEREMREDINLG